MGLNFPLVDWEGIFKPHQEMDNSKKNPLGLVLNSYLQFGKVSGSLMPLFSGFVVLKRL